MHHTKGVHWFACVLHKSNICLCSFDMERISFCCSNKLRSPVCWNLSHRQLSNKNDQFLNVFNIREKFILIVLFVPRSEIPQVNIDCSDRTYLCLLWWNLIVGRLFCSKWDLSEPPTLILTVGIFVKKRARSGKRTKNIRINYGVLFEFNILIVNNSLTSTLAT